MSLETQLLIAIILSVCGIVCGLIAVAVSSLVLVERYRNRRYAK